MFTRRQTLKSILATGSAAALTSAEPSFATPPLTWKSLPAGENGFFRAPVLITGQHEAILIDGGFTLPDGRAVAAEIEASGRTLKTIYITQSDPDYYFSLGPIHNAFPKAKVLATHDTVAAIEASVQKKLDTWGPQLKDNGPQTLADIVLPKASDALHLTLEGKTIEIVVARGLPNRRYLWVPSLNAIFGGVLVFSGVHVWTADTATAEGRAAWIKTLEEMAAREPKVVVPGHMMPGAPLDASAITYTRSYLCAFEEELAKAKDSSELIEAMTKRYPQAGMGVALAIGAKVALGEMKWG